MTSRSLACFALCCLFLTACSTAEPAATPDSGSDSGGSADTGGADGGGGEDAATEDDAATEEDAATGDDAATDEDAATDVDAGAPGGMCTNPDDLAALPEDHGGMTVAEHAQACAFSCISSTMGAMRQACINDCIQEPARVNGEISTECTSCFALAADCTITNCVGSCALNPMSAACVTCQCEMCAPATSACMGIPDSRCTP